jgi:large subunit ribosomal protein L43
VLLLLLLCQCCGGGGDKSAFSKSAVRRRWRCSGVYLSKGWLGCSERGQRAAARKGRARALLPVGQGGGGVARAPVHPSAMCTRGVWQLEKLVVQYCKIGGSSLGARQFVRYGLAGVAEQNPQVQFVARERHNRHPLLIASYRRGEDKVWSLRKMGADEVLSRVQELRNMSGRKPNKIKNFQVTHNPTVQGEWKYGVVDKAAITIHNL